MTKNEFEAFAEGFIDIFEGTQSFCRYCGAELTVGEIDICDGCFDSEQLRM